MSEFAIFLRKAGRNLDLQINFLDHARQLIPVNTFDDVHILRRKASLFAKTQHINACASPDGGKK